MPRGPRGPPSPMHDLARMSESHRLKVNGGGTDPATETTAFQTIGQTVALRERCGGFSPFTAIEERKDSL